MEAIALLALGLLATIVVFAGKLLVRFVSRGPLHALTSLDRTSRSLFGPAAPPEELCTQLRQKHLELMPGIDGGLAFVCSGCRGRLDFILDATEIRFELDDRLNAGLEVSTATMMTRLAEDNPEAFAVRGSDELYRQVFADPDLSRMMRDWGVGFTWKVGPSGFWLRIRALPRNEEEVWRWLKGAFRLLQALPGFQAAPPVQITSAMRRPSAGSVCQVCGGSLATGSVVFCRQCATPHHDECRTYARECSTFACRERQFLR